MVVTQHCKSISSKKDQKKPRKRGARWRCI